MDVLNQFSDKFKTSRHIVQLFIFVMVMITSASVAQTESEIKAIKSELAEIRKRDQKTRTNGDSLEYIAYIDSCNLAQVERLIAKYGWMGKSVIGEAANITLWVVIQHAELETQEKYYPLLKKSVEEGESNPQDLALLHDRILMRQGKKQLYGSQVVFNKSTGDPEFYPIEDEKNVNIRRKEVQLEPIEKYAEYFGIKYKLPDNTGE